MSTVTMHPLAVEGCSGVVGVVEVSSVPGVGSIPGVMGTFSGSIILLGEEGTVSIQGVTGVGGFGSLSQSHTS